MEFFATLNDLAELTLLIRHLTQNSFGCRSLGLDSSVAGLRSVLVGGGRTGCERATVGGVVFAVHVGDCHGCLLPQVSIDAEFLINTTPSRSSRLRDFLIFGIKTGLRQGWRLTSARTRRHYLGLSLIVGFLNALISAYGIASSFVGRHDNFEKCGRKCLFEISGTLANSR